MLAEVEGVVGDAQLAQQLGERCALGAFRHKVGHRVQADVVFAPFDAVEGVEPAAGIVLLQDDDVLACRVRGGCQRPYQPCRRR